MEDKKQVEIYSTRDLYLASTLMTCGFELLNIDYQIEGSKRHPVGYFAFKKTEELDKATNDYIHGKLLVDPKMFITNIWGLKATVVNAYKNPNNEINSQFKGK